jgi:hypothetical protein
LGFQLAIEMLETGRTDTDLWDCACQFNAMLREQKLSQGVDEAEDVGIPEDNMEGAEGVPPGTPVYIGAVGKDGPSWVVSIYLITPELQTLRDDVENEDDFGIAIGDAEGIQNVYGPSEDATEHNARSIIQKMGWVEIE